jgi:pimeloyl-ACP methyl ester carboxylesterase
MIKEVHLTNGETIAYRERQGGEKKVLLIHGNMTSSKHWDLVLNKMPDEYKLYALDLRGFGLSSYKKLITSIKDFSDDVKLFVDEIGLKDFAVVGWSTGGAVAMQFTADYPGYCNKLILLASESTRGYPFEGKLSENDVPRRFTSYEDIKRDIIRTLPVQAAYDTNNTDLLKLIWNAVIYTKNQPAPELYDEYVQDMRTQRNLAEVHHSNNTFNISHHHNGLVEGNGLVDKINVPVLVLRGDRDLVVTAEMTRELVEDLGPKAKFVELKDCGHSPLIDDLPQLLNEVTNFLNTGVLK